MGAPRRYVRHRQRPRYSTPAAENYALVSVGESWATLQHTHWLDNLNPCANTNEGNGASTTRQWLSSEMGGLWPLVQAHLDTETRPILFVWSMAGLDIPIDGVTIPEMQADLAELFNRILVARDDTYVVHTSYTTDWGSNPADTYQASIADIADTRRYEFLNLEDVSTAFADALHLTTQSYADRMAVAADRSRILRWEIGQCQE